jgi:hypothetical protein
MFVCDGKLHVSCISFILRRLSKDIYAPLLSDISLNNNKENEKQKHDSICNERDKLTL